MPIYISVYHLDRTIIGKTEGEVTLADIEGYLDDIVKARAVSYRKIFDATSGTSVLTAQDLETLRATLAEFARTRREIGPCAVVTGGERDERLADICRTAMAIDRPMRIFADIHSARRWLDETMPLS